MSGATGSLDITARRLGQRTVLGRVRYEGISRCSRAFAEGDAVRVVTSQLGPGVVQGDLIVSSGRLEAGAHLIVTQQAATRLMGGKRSARAQTHWALDAGALLELLGEPLIGYTDARYDAVTTVDLAAGARVLISEIACTPTDSAVRIRTSVQQHSRELFYDAFDAAAAGPQVIGSFSVIGIDAPCIARVLAALDAVSADDDDTRQGAGALPAGVFARILGNDVWTVRAALIALRGAARDTLNLPLPQ